MRRRQTISFRWAALATVCASLLYCSWPLGFLLNPKVMRSGLASELGALGQPYAWLFIGADIVSGMFLVAAVVLLARAFRVKGWRKAGLSLLALYGICGALDAALPLKCLPSLQACGSVWHDPMMILHGTVDFAGSAALIGTLVAEWMHAQRYRTMWLPWIYSIGGGGVVFAGLSLWFIVASGPGYWAQRYYLTLSCIWVASIPFMIRWQNRVTIEELI